MRRWFVLSLIPVAGFVAVWSLSPQAQVIDGDPCRRGCYEQKSECISACGEHVDPIECEAGCDDALTGCLETC